MASIKQAEQSRGHVIWSLGLHTGPKFHSRGAAALSIAVAEPIAVASNTATAPPLSNIQIWHGEPSFQSFAVARIQNLRPEPGCTEWRLALT